MNKKKRPAFYGGAFCFGNGERVASRGKRRVGAPKVEGFVRGLTNASVPAVFEPSSVGEEVVVVDLVGAEDRDPGCRRGRTVEELVHSTLLRKGGLDVRDTTNGSSRTGEE